MLTSACPGWVCYAEKTTPAAIPYISTTKSPQQVRCAVGFLMRSLELTAWDAGCQCRTALQILGSIVKDRLAPASGVAAKDVLLVGIMPCFDKKLEASRKVSQPLAPPTLHGVVVRLTGAVPLWPLAGLLPRGAGVGRCG